MVSGLLFLSTTFAQCDVTYYLWNDQSSKCLEPYVWGIMGIAIFGWCTQTDASIALLIHSRMECIHRSMPGYDPCYCLLESTNGQEKESGTLSADEHRMDVRSYLHIKAFEED